MTGPLFIKECWWALVLTAIAAYLLGSISFAIIVTRLHSHTDIRDYGSGNAGATNVLRSQGLWPAIWTTVGDLAKSVASVLIGYWLVHGALVLAGGAGAVRYELVGKFVAGLFCVLGHLYPLYFGFRGGKGVMTSFGMILILDWRAALCCLGVFLLVLLIGKMVSLGSVCAAISLPVFTLLFSYFVDGQRHAGVLWLCGIMTVLFAAILIIKHIPNLRRIANGTESRISIKKKEDA